MEKEVVDNPTKPITFEFPIINQEWMTTLKNIPPSTFPKFYGLIIEGPNMFMFKFDVLCKSFDYTIDAHKMKLFPTTFKDVSL